MTDLTPDTTPLPPAPVELWMISGNLYLDKDARVPISTPIGPFDSSDDAMQFMWKLRPFYGSWEVQMLHNPINESERIHKPDAANFLRQNLVAPDAIPELEMTPEQREAFFKMDELATNGNTTEVYRQAFKEWAATYGIILPEKERHVR